MPRKNETITAGRDVILGSQTNITQVIQLPAFVPMPNEERSGIAAIGVLVCV